MLDGDFDRSEQDFITSIGQRLLLSNSEIKNLIISTIQNEGLKIDPHIKNLVKLINSQNSQSNFSTFYGHVSTPIIKREGNSSVERRDVDLVI